VNGTMSGPTDELDPAGCADAAATATGAATAATAATAKEATRRPGRPRDARADEAILDAAVAVLARCGPGGFTVDAVAALAGVGKATIYRRWPSRAELLLETANRAVIDLTDPDTGSVRSDLVFVLSALAVKLRLTDTGRVLPALMAEAAINAEMSRTLTRFIEERRELSVQIVQRAVDRGELPADTDVVFLLELAAAPIFYRQFVARQAVEPEDVERMVDAALRAVESGGVRQQVAAADPPAS
jgi:AcrR family transcriptional regulator